MDKLQKILIGLHLPGVVKFTADLPKSEDRFKQNKTKNHVVLNSLLENFHKLPQGCQLLPINCG